MGPKSEVVVHPQWEIKGTVLEKHIVLDASTMELIKQKAYNTINLTGI